MKLQNGVICKGWNILRSFYHHDYATTKPSYLGSKLPITYDKYFSLCITINLTSVLDVDVQKWVCKCVAGVGSTLATYSTADTYTWVYLAIPGYTWTLTTVHLMSGGHPLVGFYPISPLDGVKIPNFPWVDKWAYDEHCTRGEEHQVLFWTTFCTIQEVSDGGQASQCVLFLNTSLFLCKV